MAAGVEDSQIRRLSGVAETLGPTGDLDVSLDTVRGRFARGNRSRLWVATAKLDGEVIDGALCLYHSHVVSSRTSSTQRGWTWARLTCWWSEPSTPPVLRKMVRPWAKRPPLSVEAIQARLFAGEARLLGGAGRRDSDRVALGGLAIALGPVSNGAPVGSRQWPENKKPAGQPNRRCGAPARCRPVRARSPRRHRLWREAVSNSIRAIRQ